MFGDEIAVRCLGAFGQAGCAGGVVELGYCFAGGRLVVETNPVAFAVGEERAVGAVACWHGGCGWSVEDEEAFADVDIVGSEGVEHVREDLWFGEDEFDVGDADGVGKLGGRVGWVCADTETTGADYGED